MAVDVAVDAGVDVGLHQNWLSDLVTELRPALLEDLP